MPQPRFWFIRIVWAISSKKVHQGLPIGLLLPSRQESDTQFGRVAQALDLLATVNPQRLARIRRDVRRILVVGARRAALGSWYRGPRLVTLAPDWVSANDTTPEAIASTIVHEAPHARLEGFGYAEPIRARIERICHHQEYLFARRLPHGEALAAAARRAMDRDPQTYTRQRQLDRYLDALAHLGCPAWLIRAVSRAARYRAA